MVEKTLWGAFERVGADDGPHQFLRDVRRIPFAATPISILATVVSNLTALALPFAILIVYDRIIPNATEQTLLLLLGGVAVALLIDVIARLARGQVTTWRAARYSHRAFMGGAARILFADPRIFESASAAQRLEELGAIDTVLETRSGYLPQIAADLPFFILFVAAVFAIGGDLGYVLLGCIGVQAITSYANGRAVRRHTMNRQKAARSQTNFLFEVLRGMITIKTFSMERLMARRYEKVMERSAQVTHDLFQDSGFTQATANWVTQLTTGAIVCYGSLLVVNGQMTVGGVAASMLLAGRALQPLNRASTLWSQYQTARIARGHVDSLAKIPLVAQSRDTWLADFKGGIELKDVWFGYDPDAPVLRGVSLSVAPGEAVALTGEQWSGKSTLLAVMAGIVKPDSGTVLLDGVDSVRLSDASIRGAIAFMGKQPALFEGTILENICGFDMSPERVEQALSMAEEIGLSEAVSSLSKGFAMRISASADALPASTRQLIPIVRALSREPAVIIMDECNTNLDQTTDTLFRQALERRKGHLTIVMVSQRPSFLSLADRRIDLGAAPSADAIPLDLNEVELGPKAGLPTRTEAAHD